MINRFIATPTYVSLSRELYQSSLLRVHSKNYMTFVMLKKYFFFGADISSFLQNVILDDEPFSFHISVCVFLH